jgi:UDP-3-O-[3-hydroxymyristoyl] glucosamine N-acyltransferase
VITIAEIAKHLDAEIFGESKEVITSLLPIDKAETGSISFCAQNKFVEMLALSNASAVLVKEEHRQHVKNTAIVVADPYLAFASISVFFDWRKPLKSSFSEGAVLGSNSHVADRTEVCHGVSIADNVTIGESCYIGANCVIGDDCIIGSNTRLEANVTLYADVHIGDNCIVHASAVIGADGFGFAKKTYGWQKIYQLGGVRIGNDVEIGASTTIDRGAIANTIIGNGVKLDNQIQIAHNVVLGANTAIAGGTAIAGSTHIGENCTIAGQSGITGHLTIAAGTHITAMSLISHSIKEAGVYSSGTGMEEHKTWKRNVVRFRNLDKLARQVKLLEDELKKRS